MRISIRTALVSLAAGLMWSGSSFAAGAATYLFHLSCTDRVFVAQWDTGLLDPGRENIRRRLLAQFPRCLVSGYDDPRDNDLPKEKYGGGQGKILEDVPVVGRVLCGFLGC